jgi:hypothetical protein
MATDILSKENQFEILFFVVLGTRFNDNTGYTHASEEYTRSLHIVGLIHAPQSE